MTLLGLAPGEVNGFTVEDEFGGLEFIEGCFTGLLAQQPVLDKIFATQLIGAAVEVYEGQQLATWAKAPCPGPQPIAEGWSVTILPILLMNERFTVSVFTK